MSLIILFSIVFVRLNVSQAKLEKQYFTEYSAYLETEVMSLEGEILTVRMHYQDLGEQDNPTVVLIHGAFSSSHTFLPWAEKLVEEGYRVIMPDLPYFGLSDGFEDNVTSFRRSSEAIKYILDDLEITSIDIAGNSLGGAVSWFFASEYETMVKSVTLIDAVYPSSSENQSQRFPDFVRNDFIAGIVSTFTPRFLIKRLLSTAYGDPDVLNGELIGRYYDLLRRSGTRKSIITSIQEEEPELSYEERLASISVPIFLMWGKLDSWISVDTVNLFQEKCNIPDNNIIIYDELGHLPMEESPIVTVDDFIGFIDSQ
jgi:pimeloyl-ACP methyl ester carboxylesterase